MTLFSGSRMQNLPAETPEIVDAQRCRSASPSLASKSRSLPRTRVALGPQRHGDAASKMCGSPSLPPRSPNSGVLLPLWQASSALQQLCALAAELKCAWCASGAEDAVRLEDTEAVAIAAIEALQPRLDAWKQRNEELEKRCEAIRAQVQSGVDELEGEFGAELVKLEFVPLFKRLPALQKLATEVNERQCLAHQLQSERLKLLELFGRKAVAEATRSSGKVTELKAEVAVLDHERSERLETINEAAQVVREILKQLCIQPVDSTDKAICSGCAFGMLDSEYARLLERRAMWEADRDRRVAARGSAERIRAIWQELGECQEDADRIVMAMLNLSAQAMDDDTISALDKRRNAWDERRGAAKKELARLHAALRSFGGPGLAEVVIAAHDTLHKKDRDFCRDKLRELQVSVREKEEPQRARLNQIHEQAGMDMIALEDFYRCLEEAETLELRGKMLAKELDRAEKYLVSVQGILEQIGEIKALAIEGARFESNKAADKDRFHGNALHFLEEEKYRKTFARRYSQLRDGLIGKIEAWESAEQRCFVYCGAVLRERFIALRGEEAELMSAPGDLRIVGMLLEFLGVKDVSVNRRKPSHAAGRPPRDPVPDARASPDRKSVV